MMQLKFCSGRTNKGILGVGYVRQKCEMMKKNRFLYSTVVMMDNIPCLLRKKTKNDAKYRDVYTYMCSTQVCAKQNPSKWWNIFSFFLHFPWLPPAIIDTGASLQYKKSNFTKIPFKIFVQIHASAAQRASVVEQVSVGWDKVPALQYLSFCVID